MIKLADIATLELIGATLHRSLCNFDCSIKRQKAENVVE
jgi:hypothetical protein